MKTAISVPDVKAARHARVAAKYDLNRSEFYTRAADKYADELEGEAELTRIANEVIAEVGQPVMDDEYLRMVNDAMFRGTEWR